MFKAQAWEGFGSCRMHVVAEEAFSAHLERKPKTREGELAYKTCAFLRRRSHAAVIYVGGTRR